MNAPQLSHTTVLHYIIKNLLKTRIRNTAANNVCNVHYRYTIIYKDVPFHMRLLVFKNIFFFATKFKEKPSEENKKYFLILKSIIK